MFLVGILFLLCSAWWPLQWGFLSTIGTAWCLWFYPCSWQIGVAGGVALWVGHLFWVFPFLINECHMELVGAGILCFLLAGYISLATVFFFRMVIFMAGVIFSSARAKWALAGTLYMWWACTASFPFFSCPPGHILLNPILPTLVWARNLVSYDVPSDSWHLCHIGDRDMWFYYLPPPPSGSRALLEQRLYKALFAVPPVPGGAPGFIVSPESTFQYPLQVNDSTLSLWKSALPANVLWAFGAVHQCEEKINQTFYFLGKSPITGLYEKRFLVDLFESPARGLLQKVVTSAFAFREGVFSSGGREGFVVNGLEPALCSDLLFLEPDRREGVLLGTNESWFPDFMKLLWQGYGLYWSLTRGRVLIWVGQKECRITGIGSKPPIASGK